MKFLWQEKNAKSLTTKQVDVGSVKQESEAKEKPAENKFLVKQFLLSLFFSIFIDIKGVTDLSLTYDSK